MLCCGEGIISIVSSACYSSRFYLPCWFPLDTRGIFANHGLCSFLKVVISFCWIASIETCCQVRWRIAFLPSACWVLFSTHMSIYTSLTALILQAGHVNVNVCIYIHIIYIYKKAYTKVYWVAGEEGIFLVGSVKWWEEPNIWFYPHHLNLSSRSLEVHYFLYMMAVGMPMCGWSILERPPFSLMGRHWITGSLGKKATERMGTCWGWTIWLASWKASLKDELRRAQNLQGFSNSAGFTQLEGNL